MATDKYQAPHWATPPERKELCLQVRRSGSESVIATHPIATRASYVIGRLVGLADIVVEDTELSRQHAALVHSKGKLYLIDLRSAKGVFIGNKRPKPMEPVELGEGATFRLGDSSPLRFIVRGLVAPPPSTASAAAEWKPPEWAITPSESVAMILEKDGKKVCANRCFPLSINFCHGGVRGGTPVGILVSPFIEHMFLRSLHQSTQVATLEMKEGIDVCQPLSSHHRNTQFWQVQSLEVSRHPSYTLGRKGKIVVPDESVSRVHAALIHGSPGPDGKGTVHIIDFNSTKGTFVDQGSGWKRLQPQLPTLLPPGGKVTCP